MANQPYQNENEYPRYSDPEHPYSGSGPRYQNNYNRYEYHAGDGPFQFPWWAIVVGFVVWWPLGFIFIMLNGMMKKGKLGGFETRARRTTQNFSQTNARPVYEAESRPIYSQGPDGAPQPDKKPDGGRNSNKKSPNAKNSKLALGLSIFGVLLLIGALSALPDGFYWLPEALSEGGYYWRWLVQDAMPGLIALTGGIGCLLGARHIRTTRRIRKKIDNIVGDSQYMYIQDIAAAVPCDYDKCCKHLENCIDEGLFGPDAYLDMKRKCLVVTGKAPDPEPKKPAKPKKEKPAAMPEKDQYQKILDELRRVNDAIPDEEMTDKISRLEAVSAKIFDQAKTDPDKLPQMRKFMDYYLPTSLKLLNTYAELDQQGIEGENITESKRRIEQTMDTLVHAFETQLDRLFESDALDVSTDIDVMQNMLRADGLTDDAPFKL